MTIINIICPSQNDAVHYPQIAKDALTSEIKLVYAVKIEGKVFMLFIGESEFIETSMVKTSLSMALPKETSIIVSELRGDIKPMLFGDFKVI